MYKYVYIFFFNLVFNVPDFVLKNPFVFLMEEHGIELRL